jgi:hypothetical protein
MPTPLVVRRRERLARAIVLTTWVASVAALGWGIAATWPF